MSCTTLPSLFFFWNNVDGVFVVVAHAPRADRNICCRPESPSPRAHGRRTTVPTRSGRRRTSHMVCGGAVATPSCDRVADRRVRQCDKNGSSLQTFVIFRKFYFLISGPALRVLRARFVWDCRWIRRRQRCWARPPNGWRPALLRNRKPRWDRRRAGERCSGCTSRFWGLSNAGRSGWNGQNRWWSPKNGNQVYKIIRRPCKSLCTSESRFVPYSGAKSGLLSP